MSNNPWGSKPRRFVVEELLDLFPVVRSPNNHAPPAASDFGEEAERKAEELANERTRTTTKCTSF
jgi:hypothetical protein